MPNIIVFTIARILGGTLFMNRRKSRELAMKLLFEISINKNDFEEVINNYKEENDNKDIDFNYVTRVLKGIEDNREEIDSKIQKNLSGWKMERVSKVSISILRLAVYEILFEDEIPMKVSVNEAVELSKNYSEDKAWAFVNGVLGSIAKEMEE